MMVGGLAAVLQGAPIVTADVDILHRRTSENVQRLLAALQELDAVYRLDPRRLKPTEAHLIGPGHALLSTKFGDLDVLGTIFADVTYDDVAAETIAIELGEITIRVLELSRLIESKEFAARPKDAAMLPALRATLEEIRKRR
ncbi:MAG TPA: hypothetical protein VMS65_14980 [Polyangiaceae bacterium]|nr:hypothetical protein [Polyangiaceae bacterium]